jgi:transposase
MARRLHKQQWTQIVDFLRQHRKVYVGKEAECRRFIEGVHWISRTGAQWRELPDKYGKWNTVYKRFRRWCEAGIWEEMMQHFACDPAWEWLVVDSTIVRAHPCAAGAPAKKGGKSHKR